jgi:outer membrane immunogenic protein
MPKYLLSTAASVAGFILVCGAAAPASAQQNPLPIYYGGWYVGVNAGGSWADTKLQSTLTPGTAGVVTAADAAAINALPADKNNKAGFTGGIEGGYEYMYDQHWMFGAEADWEAIDIKSGTTKNINSASVPGRVYQLNQSTSAGWMFSLRPRIGYVASARWLVYGTAGIAWSDLKYAANITATGLGTVGSTSSSATKTGFVGGAGTAYAFNDKWSVKAEWLWADFGKVNSATTATSASLQANDTIAANLIRVGLDYRF